MDIEYKSIRIFCEKFEEIFTQLNRLATNERGKTKQDSHHLCCSCSSPTFLVCLVVISTYSSLQTIQLDLLGFQKHICYLIDIFSVHRRDAELHFKNYIYGKVLALAQSLNIEITAPRQCEKQMHRSNPGSSSCEDYFRQSIFVPYLDSLISSLTHCFSDENSINPRS